jgi:DNA polymerase bacteriophage-type
MSRHLYIDLETRSELDVGDVGPFAYAEHPSTKILCAVVLREGDAKPKLFTSAEVLADVLFDYPLVKPFTLVAHNADFERAMLAVHCSPRCLKWSWHDTAAHAASLSLPRSLDALSKYLWPDDPSKWKDAEGHRLMLQLCRPRCRVPLTWWEPADVPDKFERLYAYCEKDVLVMAEAHRLMRPMDPKEHEIEELTRRMNWRGVRVDLNSIPLAQAHVDLHTGKLAREFKMLTGLSAKSNAKLPAVLGLPDMRKPTVRKALRGPLTKHVRRALEIQQQLAASSTAKLDAFRVRASADGRLQGALVYAGAERTGRWSSWGVQLHNLKRGMGKATDSAFVALHADALCECFEGTPRDPPERPMDPIGIVAEMMRGFLVGPFMVGDYAQIEARVLAWLAEQWDLVEVFAQHGDPYCRMASRIYERETTKKDKAERFLGKQVTLGCGYAMGHKRFREMLDEIYDVQIDEMFAKKVIAIYRGMNAKIVALWKRLMEGFQHVIVNKSQVGLRVQVTRNIAMGVLDTETVYIEIPSGRKLIYNQAHLHNCKPRYYGRNIYKGGVWEAVDTHGGKLAENITQATSRDVMAEAMLKLDAAGYPLVLTVHDEVVSEKHGTIADFQRILVESPTWAAKLPIEVECFESARYRK